MKTMVIDPRDFISGPFRNCPKCEGNEFGVLQIGGDHYIRRCRDRKCWFTQTIPLPKIRKKVIYIDQLAISNMMKVLNPAVKGHEHAASDPFWREMFELLDAVCKLQLVVCPDSDEHRNESLMSAFYEPLKRVYEHFSHGISFRDSEWLRQQQIVDLAGAWVRNQAPKFDFDPVRVSHGSIHEWQDRFIISVDAKYDQFVEMIRVQRERIHEGLGGCFIEWQKKKRTFSDCYAEEIRAYGRTILDVYLSWVRHWIEIERGIRPFDMEKYSPPRCASLITGLNYVFQSAGIPEADCIAKTAEFLLSDALAEAPFNRIEASLFAVMAMKAGAGQKEPPNRGTSADINIVSTLLPYCDAMFIDNRCRALLADIPHDYKLPYGTHIFSMNTRDEFLRYLNDLKNKCSEDHLMLVNEVYGSREPYTGIFQRKAAT